ncbi:MAG: hypothetical protein WCK42_09705 [Myxococcaceae bacterium]
MKMLLLLLFSVFSFTAQAQKGQNKIQRRELSHNAHQRKLVKNGVIDSADVIGGSNSGETAASSVFEIAAGFIANMPPMFFASGASGGNSAGPVNPSSSAHSGGDQLFIACLESDFKRIKTILESGVNINQQHSRTHLTAAHVAIKLKKPEVLAYLASQPGFNPNALSETGISLLELAVLENDRNSESILLNHPEFRIQPQRDDEPDPIKQFREALQAAE